ncbi:MAG: putative transrane efflux protein [Caulobacteraceae bacterium]|nr:putative transrane efflux protein [Caulobacteraceae bacterium]
MQDWSSRARWLAFVTLCLGDLMIVLDSTVVNIALPSIRSHLGFTETGLVWVVNAYLLTYGGFMLLGGRLADLYGQRRLFLGGIAVFTLASLTCGLAQGQAMLVIARAIQGLGGAVVSAVSLSLIMTLFPEGPSRVRAMGYFGFVMAGGGSVGVLLGGLITGTLDWRWIFLINIPIGVAVSLLSLRLLPGGAGEGGEGVRLDLGGAVTVTLSLLLAIYAIVGGDQAGWTSPLTLGLFAAAVALMVLFVFIESRVSAPLVPLGLFRSRNVSVANIISVLWAAGMFAWFFLSALYMQQVLHYGPMKVGLGFLPSNLIMGAFSLKLSAWTVNKWGIRVPLSLGLTIAAIGLVLFALAPVEGEFWLHIMPPMLLLGIGGGMAFNPVLLAAMGGVEPHESGLASGVVNTAFMMGGSIGLAILVSLAAGRTGALTRAGAAQIEALTGGYHAAFLAGAVFAFLAAGLGVLLNEPKGGAAAGIAMH